MRELSSFKEGIAYLIVVDLPTPLTTGVSKKARKLDKSFR